MFQGQDDLGLAEDSAMKSHLQGVSLWSSVAVYVGRPKASKGLKTLPGVGEADRSLPVAIRSALSRLLDRLLAEDPGACGRWLLATA